MWKEILRKLTSRKLWMAIAGIATGIAVALGVESSDVATITGSVTALISAVTYIIAEGRVDAEGVKNAVTATQDALDVLGGDTNAD